MVDRTGNEALPSADLLAHDSYYRFVVIEEPAALAALIEEALRSFDVLGTVLVATEGINVMLCGKQSAHNTARKWFEKDPRFRELFVKQTLCETLVFQRLKVKVKREIVPLGLEGIHQLKGGGRSASPQEWCELLERDDVVLIDNRNSFEFGHGRFRNALDPKVNNFREFANYFEEHLPEWGDRTIAMYCTGGIRCDKTAAWASSIGVEVVTLSGGIINFLQQTKDAEKYWDGTCFVFDERRELNADLTVATDTTNPTADVDR